jgi:hypothetical protein
MCSCIKKANKTLADFNQQIDTASVLETKGKKARWRERLYIPLSPLPGKAPRSMRLFASFCPMCGKALS